MNVLAFDTSTGAGGVALRVGSTIHGRALGRAREFASALLPTIEGLLGEADCGFADLDALVVGAGPGSFTGVRVAAASAKGLVHALEVPLYAYSSLAAAAFGPGWPDAGERAVIFDARAERVYWAAYGPDPRDEPIVAPRAGEISEVLAWSGGRPRPATFGGDGAPRHREALLSAGGEVLTDGGLPSPLGLLTLFDARADSGRVADPARWQPEYLRAWSGARPGT